MSEQGEPAEMRWSGHYGYCFGDEEAVGSNPATLTAKHQVRVLCDRVAMASGDELRDYRILFRWCIPAVGAFSTVSGWWSSTGRGFGYRG
jgi:hypothetical protein